jgi:hypothetical protein
MRDLWGRRFQVVAPIAPLPGHFACIEAAFDALRVPGIP